MTSSGPANPPSNTAATPNPASPYVFRGEGHGFLQALSWNAGRLLSRILSVLLFRFHATGQSRIPKTGGVLLVSNHQSFLDPWLMGIAPQRQLHYMARDTLFRGGFLQFLGEIWNAFPVRRGSADLTAIRTAVERLDKGFMLNIYPEGTRSEDGSIGSIAPGMILILNRCKTDICIVPSVVDGAFEAWPRSAKFPRPHQIRIIYGRAIPAAEWRKLSADELALRVRLELVKLQGLIGSAHAAESERRLIEDAAKLAAAPVRRRR